MLSSVYISSIHIRRSFIIALVICACDAPKESSSEKIGDQAWAVAGATKGNTKYSPLKQVNRDNVHQLQLAWEYHSGDEGYAIECNPIIIDGTLYATSPAVKAFALDAATGEERWTFDPFAYEKNDQRMRKSSAVNRGMTSWKDGEEHRLFFGTGPFMYAIDAKTGQPIRSFGENGRIDLSQGLDREVEDLWINASSPGIVYDELLIVGAQVSEGEGAVTPGHVRAYDVRTGERKWIFHTIPYPGEYGYDTWPKDAWKTFGGANAWGGFSLDEARGMLFFGTGSASHDHFGINRRGQNLFANSVVALNAETGERVWHYQLVHHDLWDYDIPTPPNLLSVTHNGQQVDAVAQVTKTGFVFVFNRDTGEPLFPVEERPVPQSEVPGEATWPTQPFPTRPRAYARQGFTEADITRRTPEAHAFVKENVFDTYGESLLFSPPSFKGDVVFPQFNGGTDWGGAAIDPETGFLYVNTSNEPELIQVVAADEEDDFPYDVTGHQPVKDNEGFPISTPPWGTLSAIDLNQGIIAWQVPLGGYPELEDLGPTGTFNMGGPAVTAGGLIFIGAAMDEKFRAIDKETGKVLWEVPLPAGGYATPSVYAVAGRQYIVIGAGGGGKPGTRTGDAYLAFALPEDGETATNPNQLPTRSSASPMAEGEHLYTSRCASCHQFNGMGMGAEYPPLAESEWVRGDKGRLIRLVLGGLSGEITVKGATYEGAMPPWGDFLDDEQLASLLSYIRSSWGNDATSISPEEVASVRTATQAHKGMWTAEELAKEENRGIPEPN